MNQNLSYSSFRGVPHLVNLSCFNSLAPFYLVFIEWQIAKNNSQAYTSLYIWIKGKLRMKCFIKTKQQQELKENIISRGGKKPEADNLFWFGFRYYKILCHWKIIKAFGSAGQFSLEVGGYPQGLWHICPWQSWTFVHLWGKAGKFGCTSDTVFAIAAVW